MTQEDRFSTLLARRRREYGAAPLLTYYDLGTGERTELSAITFGNWVDKTANLLLDADLEPGEPVAVDLLLSDPGHWVSAIWCAAVWLCEAVVAPMASARIRVIGPAAVQPPGSVSGATARTSTIQPAETAELTLACSLHPLGLGFSTPLPAGVSDYGVEVRGFPDVFCGPPADDGIGWRDDEVELRQSALIAAADGDPDARLLVRPGAPRLTVGRTLLRPLRGTGSSVSVVGDASPEILSELRRVERAAPPLSYS